MQSGIAETLGMKRGDNKFRKVNIPPQQEVIVQRVSGEYWNRIKS